MSQVDAMRVYAPVAFALIGAVAGWVGGMLLKRRGFGPVGNIVLGVIGACIGGVLVGATGLAEPGAMGSLLAAALGAVVLLVGLGLTRKG
jgi:uncharacterized membrane protein YeaQ/YmgE (transglycosylase-associated protein family)